MFVLGISESERSKPYPPLRWRCIDGSRHYAVDVRKNQRPGEQHSRQAPGRLSGLRLRKDCVRSARMIKKGGKISAERGSISLGTPGIEVTHTEEYKRCSGSRYMF
jgi:hypothetical protein